MAARSPVEHSSLMLTLRTTPNLRILMALLVDAERPSRFPAESRW
jgi:hypothetical protein